MWVWAEIECSVHVALPKRPLNQFKPVQQLRQLMLRAFCTNIFILCKKVLEKFAKYEEVKTRKRNKLIQKGIDFFMDTLERTKAIEQNPKKEIVK